MKPDRPIECLLTPITGHIYGRRLTPKERKLLREKLGWVPRNAGVVPLALDIRHTGYLATYPRGLGGANIERDIVLTTIN